MAESLTVDGVMNALRNCYDPEIPVNIVDLGLVYGVAINEANSRYLGSNDIANLWEKSNGEKTIDEITTDIATEKNLSPTEIRVQVLESITQLITIGLVHPEESITLPLHT